jgi:ATP-dependent DNA helicase RecG
VLGSAQSGATSHLRLLRVIRDEALILRAREIAEEITNKIDQYPVLIVEIDKLRQEERATYLEKK